MADLIPPRRIAILGSTGSIGTSTLDVVRRSNGNLKVVGLSGRRNIDLLKKQAEEFNPKLVCLGDDTPSAESDLIKMVTNEEVDIVVVAIVGFAALRPTLAAVEAGKTIALANKEVLVAGGKLLTDAARKSGSKIIPVDSEHNALFQALQGHSWENIDHLTITASGGPFRGHTKNQLASVTKEQALNHPKWKMGPKITIDSATMMNKGLEIIEACHLFGISPDKVEVLVHPQSIVHGLVNFVDGTVLAHLAPPDMKAAISYSLYYPHRQPQAVEKLDLLKVGRLDFEPVDNDAFPSVDLARQAFRRGSLATTALNAANEIAVEAFLNEQIRFIQIAETVESILIDAPQGHGDLKSILEMDEKTRKWTRDFLRI